MSEFDQEGFSRDDEDEDEIEEATPPVVGAAPPPFEHAPKDKDKSRRRSGMGKPDDKKPHVKTSPFQADEATLLWQEILTATRDTGRSASDIMISVARLDLGQLPVGLGHSFDGSLVEGDGQMQTAASALSDMIADAYHIPSNINRPATYQITFYSKAGGPRGGFLTRGKIHLDHPTVLQNIRAAQNRASGVSGPPAFVPNPYQHQPQQPPPPQPYVQPHSYTRQDPPPQPQSSAEYTQLAGMVKDLSTTVERLARVVLQDRSAAPAPAAPTGLGGLGQVGEAVEEITRILGKLGFDLRPPQQQQAPAPAPVVAPTPAASPSDPFTGIASQAKQSVAFLRELRSVLREFDKLDPAGVGAPPEEEEEEEEQVETDIVFKEVGQEGKKVQVPFTRDGNLALSGQGLAGFFMANPPILSNTVKVGGKIAEVLIKKVGGAGFGAPPQRMRGAQDERIQAEEVEEEEEEEEEEETEAQPNGSAEGWDDL